MIFRKIANKIVNKHILWNYLKDAKDWVYEIVKVDWDKRTNDQNKYLWWAVYPAIHSGLNGVYTIDEIHSLMSFKFLQRMSKGWSPYILSTSRLTTAEFSKYVEQIKDFVAQYGVYIPTAEEYKQWLKDLTYLFTWNTWTELEECWRNEPAPTLSR